MKRFWGQRKNLVHEDYGRQWHERLASATGNGYFVRPGT